MVANKATAVPAQHLIYLNLMGEPTLQHAESVLSLAFFESWETTTREGFSVDQLIDAYMIGKEHGKTEERRILNRIFEDNIKKAVTFSEEKFHELTKIFEIRPVSMKLKIQSISAYEILFMLQESDYKSEKIKTVYSYLIDAMSKICSESFNWSFVVMPHLSELDDLAIHLDGYSLTYANKARD